MFFYLERWNHETRQRSRLYGAESDDGVMELNIPSLGSDIVFVVVGFSVLMKEEKSGGLIKVESTNTLARLAGLVAGPARVGHPKAAALSLNYGIIISRQNAYSA